jgi:hypothetical protein
MRYRIVEKISLFLFAFFCAVVAILARDCYCAKGTEFWQMSFYNILQLGTTLFIAFFIAHHLKNRYSDKQLQKNLFLEVAKDIVKIFENEFDFLFNFMQQTERNEDNKIKVLLLITKISNKITILEDHADRFDENTKILVSRLRGYFDSIENIVSGGEDFVKPVSFSNDNINNVLRTSFNIIFVLDQIKLNIFD